MLFLQEASEHKAPHQWFRDSWKVFTLDLLTVQLVKLPVFSAEHNNKDKWGWVCALIRLPVHFLLKS